MPVTLCSSYRSSGGVASGTLPPEAWIAWDCRNALILGVKGAPRQPRQRWPRPHIASLLVAWHALGWPCTGCQRELSERQPH